MFKIWTNTFRKRIKDYNLLRQPENQLYFCKAPFGALRFHRNGSIQVCCHHIDYYDLHERKLKDIWFGDELNVLRKQMYKFEIPDSCSFCKKPFLEKDYGNVAALSFDYLQLNENGYPVLLDFSLENTCNLACVMCDASLSSKIKEKKSLENKFNTTEIYNKFFVEQIKDYIPHLKYAVFTGGEPFLIKIYYDIWDIITKLNSEVIINITTNGTILNDKIRELIHKANVNITVSIDSFIPEIYESIRVGANFNKTWNNITEFSEILKSKNKHLNITVCPLKLNAHEIPEMVSICNKNQWIFNYNIVLKPWDLALWSLSENEIQQLIDYYKIQKFSTNNDIAEQNIIKYKLFINLLKNWKDRIILFNKNKIEVSQLVKYRQKLKDSILKKLDNNIGIQEKLDDTISRIPDILIRNELLNYFENLPAKVIYKEFTENDSDSILDHFCIVGFNL